MKKFLLGLAIFFALFALAQQADAINCGDSCSVSERCGGVWVCYPPRDDGQPSGGYCKPNIPNCGDPGDTPSCGDGFCMTGENCPADCGNSGGPKTCKPNCFNKMCGQDDDCGKTCWGWCPEKNKACNPNTHRCVNANGCTDSDADVFNRYYEQGITKGKNPWGTITSKKDVCEEGSDLEEYFCLYNGAWAHHEVACKNGCVDGACKCVDDTPCGPDKVCNKTTGKCVDKCIDSDADKDKYKDGKNPYVKGTVKIGKNGKESPPDIYYAATATEPSYVFEYYCTDQNTIGDKKIYCTDNGEKNGKNIGGKNGACYECANDFNCPSGTYCNMQSNKCVKNVPHNCCIGYIFSIENRGAGGGYYFDNICTELKSETDCINEKLICKKLMEKNKVASCDDKKIKELKGQCVWAGAGYPEVKRCLPSYSAYNVMNDLYRDFKKEKCDSFAYFLTDEAEGRNQLEKYQQRHSCKNTELYSSCFTDNDCPEGFWCTQDNKCIKNTPHTCCAAVVKPVASGAQDLICPTFTTKDQCDNYRVSGSRRQWCFWGPYGYPTEYKCGINYAGNFSKSLAEIIHDKNKCSKLALFSIDSDADYRNVDLKGFFNRHDCSDFNFFVNQHADKNQCSVFFGYMKECKKCVGAQCSLMGGGYSGCSVGGDPESVQAGAKDIQNELIENNDHRTKYIISLNQMVSSACAPTEVEIMITYSTISYNYFPCDKVYEYNSSKSSGCSKGAPIIEQARYEKAMCMAGNVKHMVMCCPAPERPGEWELRFVNAYSPDCSNSTLPKATATFSILKNFAALMNSVLNNLWQTTKALFYIGQ